MRARTALVAGAVVLAALVGGALVVARTFTPTQPIAFNHHVHLEDVGLECVDCHVHARDGARATIPNVDVCAPCHEEAVDDSAAAVAVTDAVTHERTIPWQKVTVVPGHVWFSHRRHTAVAGIGCETCHGDMAARTTPITRPMVPVTMQHCIDCHDERGVTVDCVACHR